MKGRVLLHRSRQISVSGEEFFTQWESFQRLSAERLCKRIWKTTIEQNGSFPGPTQKEKKIINWLDGYRSLDVVGKRGWQMIEPWKLLLNGQ
jgi:hypothetical protein